MIDLMFASYLLAANYATTVILHGKNTPWFVSDVTAHDLKSILNTLDHANFLDPVTEDGARSLKQFGSEFCGHFESGRLHYEAHLFWTTQYPYARLPEVAPQLYVQLTTAELVIFKGDLNYRRLVLDELRPSITSLQQALGALGMPAETGKPGLRILALRTCEFDTCVGLRPGRKDMVDPYCTSEWTETGKYAVVSFCDAKSRA